MNKKKITVIIPFLNEGEEIENTVRSIRDTAGDNVDILLINDNSADKTNYESVAKKYHTLYYKNSERKGVAESRNIGVRLIQTPYFVLIDGHMRFYNNNWWISFINCLENDDRALYSGNCIVLNANGEIYSKSDRAYGAFINFTECLPNWIMEPTWIRINHYPDENIIEIPCVLGASYAMSVRYWNYLHGLEGLRYYGNDEPYISLKVWLEGGKCYLIKSAEIGHIFRNEAPYKMVAPDRIYNRLYIAKTILPEEECDKIEKRIKAIVPTDYNIAASVLKKQAHDINENKAYYRQIFTRDFTSFLKINQNVSYHVSRGAQMDDLLRDIWINTIQTNPSEGVGLMTGEMGEIVFLYEYAHAEKNVYIKNKADKQFENYLKRLNKNISHYDFYSGTAGIGTALKYLNDKEYIDFDWQSYFSAIEKPMYIYMAKQFETNKLGFMHGATGIAYYFMKKGLDVLKEDAFIQKLNDYVNTDNYGLYDGLTGILSFLLNVRQEKLSNAPVDALIEKYISTIKNNQPQESQICESGDLIDAYLLLKAAYVINDETLKKESEDKLELISRRRDSIKENVWDASIYNGSIGTGFVYALASEITKSAQLKEASNFWLDDILYKIDYDAFLRPYKLQYQKYAKGLLHGLSGIGLCLAAFKYKNLSTQWKSWILL